MIISEDIARENIAATLARVLPAPQVVHQQSTSTEEGAIVHMAIPRSMEHIAVDHEKLLANPRRAQASARFFDVDSFIRYVLDFQRPGTTVWCLFSPQTFALTFTAVIDEHRKDVAGWRNHRAVFSPAMSSEWKVWTEANGKSQTQVAFAEFIEANEADIAGVDGLPSSLDMHKLATEFVAKQDVSIKSVVRLQSGGAQINYINDADAGTTEAMRLFERFAIGIPVFWTAPEAGETPQPITAYRIDARLKYRVGSAKVNFHYELIRPDRVHQKAAIELIEAVRVRLGGLPLLMGTCD